LLLINRHASDSDAAIKTSLIGDKLADLVDPVYGLQVVLLEDSHAGMIAD